MIVTHADALDELDRPQAWLLLRQNIPNIDVRRNFGARPDFPQKQLDDYYFLRRMDLDCDNGFHMPVQTTTSSVQASSRKSMLSDRGQVDLGTRPSDVRALNVLE